MKKLTTALAIVACIGFSASVFAGQPITKAQFKKDMGAMQMGYSHAIKAKNAQDFKTGLEQLKTATLTCKQELPEYFTSVSKHDVSATNVKMYTDALDKIANKIPELETMADSGKLSDAIKATQSFKLDKEQYHTLYHKEPYKPGVKKK